jgi:RNA polymerase sigma-70 factor (ECF subfamily)
MAGVETSNDEPSLIARSRKGELDAFNILVDRYQDSLYNFCLRMLGSRGAAEDAAQEAFISAFRHLQRFRGGSFRSWLFRIGANACYDEMRRRKARPAISLDRPPAEGEHPHDTPDQGVTLDERMEQHELAGVIQQALSELPAEQRLAVILCDIQGFEYSEIAETMGVSLGTVKSRISRGRSRLLELLASRRELLPERFRQKIGDTR